jgi:tetratricopeptide (TPR) repeat protein
MGYREMPEKINTSTLVHKGLRELAGHRPDLAISSFKKAVDYIPPSCSDELSKALYWLSIALLRLDKRDLAIKSLASAQKLRRRGFARSIYLRTINEYGMPKQPTPELDDFYAFMNIQLATYLTKKIRKKFDTFSEREAVLKILLDIWKDLKESSTMQNSDCGEKLYLFRKVRPSFPEFSIGNLSSRVVRTSFNRTPYDMSNNRANQRCPCGSGLPYSQCCGRVKGLAEL